jgi:hypothetical protein
MQKPLCAHGEGRAFIRVTLALTAQTTRKTNSIYLG